MRTTSVLVTAAFVASAAASSDVFDSAIANQRRGLDMDNELLEYVVREALAEASHRHQRRSFDMDDEELFQLMIRDPEADPGLLGKLWGKIRGKKSGAASDAASMAGGDPSQQYQQRSIDLDADEELFQLMIRDPEADPGLLGKLWGKIRGKKSGAAQDAASMAGGDPSQQYQQRSIDLDADEELLNFMVRDPNADPGLLGKLWGKIRGKKSGAASDAASMAGGDPSQQYQQRSIDFDADEEFLQFMVREAHPGLLGKLWGKIRGKKSGAASDAASMAGGDPYQQQPQRRSLAEIDYLESLLTRDLDDYEELYY